MPRRLLMAVCALAIVPMFVACGDDDDADDSGSTPAANATTGGGQTVSVSTASPTLEKPVSRYSVSLDDIGNGWRTDVDFTFAISPSDYGKTPRLFPTEAEGMKLLKEWGYVEGYETGYLPEGADQAVLNGSYWIAVESHLFSTAEGARAAYDYFTKYVQSSGAVPAGVKPVGTRASAYVTVAGTIGKSSTAAIFHQVIFLRGNVMTIVLTKGAQGLMTPEYAWEIATLSDAKMVGERAAPEPTKTSAFKTPTAKP